LLSFFPFLLSTIIGDGCNDLLLSEPALARAESLPLVSPPFVDAEHAVSLLSVVVLGEGIKLGRDFDRRCTRASLRLFLCSGTPARSSLGGGGARYSASVGLSRLPLRTERMVWVATGEAGGKP
jgi:hypothetical protein